MPIRKFVYFQNISKERRTVTHHNHGDFRSRRRAGRTPLYAAPGGSVPVDGLAFTVEPGQIVQMPAWLAQKLGRSSAWRCVFPGNEEFALREMGELNNPPEPEPMAEETPTQPAVQPKPKSKRKRKTTKKE